MIKIMPLAAHVVATATDPKLVLATWGLVLATFLLFLASIVPAVGQFRDWSNKKKAIASTVIPVLHATRNHMLEIRSGLLSTDYMAQDTVAGIHGLVDRTRRHTAELEDSPGLSLDQRLELYVLLSHLGFLQIRLSVVASGDPNKESVVSIEEQFRQAIIQVQAALLSLDRLDNFFARSRRGTFTDEMIARVEHDNDEAEKQLVDIRRQTS